MGKRINDRAEWIEYKGKRMIFFDYSNLSGPEYVNQIERNVDDVGKISRQHGKKSLLLFVDITDSVVVPNTMSAFKQGAKELEPYLTATGVIGASGGKRTLVNIVASFSKLNTRAFVTEQDAKEWLLTYTD